MINTFKSSVADNPKLAVILGSGIDINGDFIKKIRTIHTEKSGIHNKKIYYCEISGSKILIFRGRRHYYEDFSYDDLVSNIKLASEAGSENLLITNAAGGINKNFRVGDLMLISSYINLNTKLRLPPPSVLRGMNIDDKLIRASKQAGVKLHKGIYTYVQGPNYETLTEVRFMRKYGTDAAGMSTVPEIHEAVRAGMRVSAVSVITNKLSGIIDIPATHQEVISSAKKASGKFSRVLKNLVSELN